MGVILAAGESRRLGTCKALVRLGEDPESTPLARLLVAARHLGARAGRSPLIVTGAQHEEIATHLAWLAERDPDLLGPSGPELVPNPRWREGRTGSVQRAVEARPGCDLCLAPVDVPRVPGEVFRGLARSWLEAGAPARGWLAPLREGARGRRFGHPVVAGRELLAELLAWPPERPLRALRAGARPLLALPVATDAVLEDLDGPADLAQMRRRPR